MAEHHTPVPVSQEEIARARTFWANFTLLLKIVIVASIVVLGGMALFLV